VKNREGMPNRASQRSQGQKPVARRVWFAQGQEGQ
jgi:hypothetical protein